MGLPTLHDADRLTIPDSVIIQKQRGRVGQLMPRSLRVLVVAIVRIKPTDVFNRYAQSHGGVDRCDVRCYVGSVDDSADNL